MTRCAGRLRVSGVQTLQLHHLSGPRAGQRDRLHKSAGATALLGRSPEADVSFLESQARTVSRRHALLWLATDSVDGWFVVDLGSTTGTYLNGERVQACRLAHGDLLSLGASGPALRVELLLDREVPLGSCPADRSGQLERRRAEDAAASGRS